MKTNVLLKVDIFLDTGEKVEGSFPHPHYRVKLDSKGFPYISINNEKVIITSRNFPASCLGCYALYKYEIDLIEGADEWQKIINNPELTVDKLSAINIGHAAVNIGN